MTSWLVLAQGANAPRSGRIRDGAKGGSLFGFLHYLFKSRRLEHLHFVLFTRQGCHLCEEAERLLQKEQQRYNFKLEIVDIDSQKELAAQFGKQVPVVTVNGPEQ